MNNSTNSNYTSHGAAGFNYVFTLVFGLIFLSLAIAFSCVRLRRSSYPSVFNMLAGTVPFPSANVEVTEQGLDDSTLHSFPKLLYSQAPKGTSVPSSCSICLGDYKETDTLRLLPDCGHLYHLNCIDPWLKLHPTCSICRKSPQSNSSMDEIV